MKGISVKEAAKELGTSERTVFRMLQDGRLEGQKIDLPFGDKYVWEISPVSVAKMLLQKEASGKKQYPRSRKEEGLSCEHNRRS